MIQDWLEARRLGIGQSSQDIYDFVQAVVSEKVTRAQAAAWLAFVACKGMSSEETVALTLAMRDSGIVLDWPCEGGTLMDKHSTGGVGDKVSLVLAPVWTATGLRVPMLSGRGLGITGGTLDKLESIPGYRTDLALPELQNALASVGCFINGQTRELAPADRILYALRDETGTVPSIPLITASILSKKLAEGLSKLVLDVKFGSGAFMQTEAEAQALAESLESVGNGAGVETRACLTEMNQPLGMAIGNSLEVIEAVDCLNGGGPKDLRELVLHLSPDREAAQQAIDSGSAFKKWQEMVRCHQGDPEADYLGGGCEVQVYKSQSSGICTRCDAGGLGRAAFALGAGRTRAGEAVHPGVGIQLHVKKGDEVRDGQPLFSFYHSGDQKRLERASNWAEKSYKIE